MRILCWGKEYERSAGLPWNAWTCDLEYPDGPASFEAGGWWRALEHMKRCEKCRRENNLSLDEVERELRVLEKEWEEFR